MKNDERRIVESINRPLLDFNDIVQIESQNEKEISIIGNWSKEILNLIKERKKLSNL